MQAELDGCVACGDHGCGLCKVRRKLQADGTWVQRPPGWTCTACGGHGGLGISGALGLGCGLCRPPGSQEADLTATYEAVARQQRLWELSMERMQREAMQRHKKEAEAEALRAEAEAEQLAREEAIGAFLQEHGFSEVNAAGLAIAAGCCGRKQMRLTYPLHVAAAAADGEMVAFLIQDGADPLATDAAGRTPLEVAWHRDVDGSHGVAVQCLEEALRALAEEAEEPPSVPKAERPGPGTSMSLGSPKAAGQRTTSKRAVMSL